MTGPCSAGKMYFTTLKDKRQFSVEVAPLHVIGPAAIRCENNIALYMQMRS